MEREGGHKGQRERSILVFMYSGHMTGSCYLGNGEEHVSGGGQETYITCQLVSKDLGQDHATSM